MLENLNHQNSVTATYTKADASEVNHKSFTAGSGQIVMHLDRTLQDFYVAEISQVIQQSENQIYWDSKGVIVGPLPAGLKG